MRKLILSAIEAVDAAVLELDRAALVTERFSAEELIRLQRHSVRMRTILAELRAALPKQEAESVKEAVRPVVDPHVAEIIKAAENFFRLFK